MLWREVVFQGRRYVLDDDNTVYIVVPFRYVITKDVPKSDDELRRLEEELFRSYYVRSLLTFYPIDNYGRKLIIEYADGKLYVAGVVWSREPIFVSRYSRYRAELPAITIPFPSEALPSLIYQPYSKFINMLKEYLLYSDGNIRNFNTIRAIIDRIDKLRLLYPVYSSINIYEKYGIKDLLVYANLEDYY